jgi:hypothetical protein
MVSLRYPVEAAAATPPANIPGGIGFFPPGTSADLMVEVIRKQLDRSEFN